MQQNARVFFSYSHHDKLVAAWIINFLELVYEVFWDKKIRPGEDQESVYECPIPCHYFSYRSKYNKITRMIFTERDFAILSTIQAYDGVLSVDQIHRWFFGARRRAEIRLSQLYRHKFIQRSGRAERHLVPTPIVWLSKLGAQTLAGREDIPFSEFDWRSTPRWSKVQHDMLLNEARHNIEQAALAHPTFRMENWHGQDELTSLFSKPIEYISHANERKKRIVQPDGFFSLLVDSVPSHRLRFFIELDNGTESNNRFARDKVYPGVQFIHSRMYQDVLQASVSARFLVIVHGSERRYINLRHQVAHAGGGEFFLFTRSNLITVETALRGKIWQFSHDDQRFSLEEYDTPELQTYARQSAQAFPHLRLL